MIERGNKECAVIFRMLGEGGVCHAPEIQCQSLSGNDDLHLPYQARCLAPVRPSAAGLTPKTLYHLGLVIRVVGKYVAGLFE
jgi:hypothetical protein